MPWRSGSAHQDHCNQSFSVRCTRLYRSCYSHQLLLLHAFVCGKSLRGSAWFSWCALLSCGLWVSGFRPWRHRNHRRPFLDTQLNPKVLQASNPRVQRIRYLGPCCSCLGDCSEEYATPCPAGAGILCGMAESSHVRKARESVEGEWKCLELWISVLQKLNFACLVQYTWLILERRFEPPCSLLCLFDSIPSILVENASF